mmetsp:Transcript_18765/g.33657  ORF Transcript_18765/g.33657 Transcript_18765/m.33657 type:complete len:338 (+) Transcript_18765:141-1154(+)
MTTHTPLLSATEKVVTAIEMESNSNTTPSKTNNNNEQEQLQFYDPKTLLNVTREVAFGYLILLTGGEVEYEPPTLEEVASRSSSSSSQSKLPNSNNNNGNESQPQSSTTTSSSSQRPSSTPALNEETASLAYAAILDGNVLHTCFGLKAAANGRANNNAIHNTINPPKEQSSIFCCFPNSTATLDALQLVLPHLTMNKLRMANLVEILREVGDLHLEELEQGNNNNHLSTKVPLHVQVIHGYVRCFTSIVRYHDTKQHFKKNKITKEKRNGVVVCCSKIIHRLLLRKKSGSALQLEQLQRETLLDVERGFEGVRERIWEGLERMASDTAFTGVSVEE